MSTQPATAVIAEKTQVQQMQPQKAQKRKGGPHPVNNAEIDFNSQDKSIRAAERTFKEIQKSYENLRVKIQPTNLLVSYLPTANSSSGADIFSLFKQVVSKNQELHKTVDALLVKQAELALTDNSYANRTKLDALKGSLDNLQKQTVDIAAKLGQLSLTACTMEQIATRERLEAVKEKFAACTKKFNEFKTNALNGTLPEDPEGEFANFRAEIQYTTVLFQNETDSVNKLCAQLNPEKINSDPSAKKERQDFRDEISSLWSHIGLENYKLTREARIFAWSLMKPQLDAICEDLVSAWKGIRTYKYDPQISAQGWDSYYYIHEKQEGAFISKYQSELTMFYALHKEMLALQDRLQETMNKFTEEPSQDSYAKALAKDNSNQEKINIASFATASKNINSVEFALYKELYKKWTDIKAAHTELRLQLQSMERTIATAKEDDESILIEEPQTAQANANSQTKPKKPMYIPLKDYTLDEGEELTFDPPETYQAKSLVSSLIWR